MKLQRRHLMIPDFPKVTEYKTCFLVFIFLYETQCKALHKILGVLTVKFCPAILYLTYMALTVMHFSTFAVHLFFDILLEAMSRNILCQFYIGNIIRKKKKEKKS